MRCSATVLSGSDDRARASAMRAAGAHQPRERSRHRWAICVAPFESYPVIPSRSLDVQEQQGGHAQHAFYLARGPSGLTPWELPPGPSPTALSTGGPRDRDATPSTKQRLHLWCIMLRVRAVVHRIGSTLPLTDALTDSKAEAACPSSRPPPFDHVPDRMKDDAQVQKEGPVLHVIKIIFELGACIVDRRSVRVAQLRPPRDPGFDRLA